MHKKSGCFGEKLITKLHDQPVEQLKQSNNLF